MNPCDYDYYPTGMKWFPVEDEGAEAISQRQRLNKLQVPDQAGGYTYNIDDFTTLTRYLILGNEEGAYLAREPELRRENIRCLDRLIMKGKGLEVVDLIKDISIKGRACKQKPLLYALALCCRSNDPDTKNAAYDIIPEVCRIPTYLFQFIALCEKESAGTGWGRSHKKAISAWYHSFYGSRLKLAYLVTKFRSRNSWHHKDVIRLAHVRPKNNEVGVVLRYITKGIDEAKKMYCIAHGQVQPDPGLLEIAEFLEAVEKAKQCRDEKTIISYIRRYNLVREHIPTELLNHSDVWKELLMRMPMESLIRSLGKITSIGLLQKDSEYERMVMEYIRDKERIKKSMIHPFRLLLASYHYRKGMGERGKLKWYPNENVLAAMDDAFFLCFANIKPTGKRILIAVDVSGSMNTPCVGNSVITVRDAAAAMMMITARIEKEYEIIAFANDITQLDIKPNETIHTVINKVSHMYYSVTDCSRPITYAIENRKLFDVFIVYTYSETYHGNIHPAEAIVRYRKTTGISDAKLIVVAMSSNGFSIANPADPFMMDITGFDAAAPCVMDEFIRGKII